MKAESLPELPLSEWKDTLATLHMWSQIIGKIRLEQTPVENHFWNVPLYLTPSGLTTSIIPHGERSFEIDFDFIDHELLIRTDRGETERIRLYPCSVADFYSEVMQTLEGLDLGVKIWPMPVEIENPIRFTEDTQHASYDPEYVNRFWRILVQVDRVFKEFRTRFIGKCSPVHFFWGSFDLAVTRFNGERAPVREGADPITRESYSHKVISHGFWCGDETVREPAFFSYSAPQPAGFSEARVRPGQAYYHRQYNQFILPYEAVRQSQSPERDLLEFLQSTYEAAANLGNWNRVDLERQPVTMAPDHS